jgi:ATP-dependent helicase YprA (DUF1998 family)
VLISPPPVTNSLPAKRSDKVAVIELRADPRKRIREDGKRPRARALNMLVGETDQTLVFKTTWTGTTVAIKVCRNRIVKESADAWRNEMKILSSLDHVSPRRLS